MITLTELRDLASELGLELIYMIGRSKTKSEIVTYDNFSDRKSIGLSKNGEIHLLPQHPGTLKTKLQRAVTRQKKAAHIKRTQKQYEDTE